MHIIMSREIMNQISRLQERERSIEAISFALPSLNILIDCQHKYRYR